MRAFIAAFSALASTGLLFTGRFGLALITIGATFMAIRALRRGAGRRYGSYGGPRASRPAAPKSPPTPCGCSSITPPASSTARSCAAASPAAPWPRSAFPSCSISWPTASATIRARWPLLETYLDRRQPDWRDHAAGGPHGQDQAAASAAAAMDEATAWSILGLAPGAGEDEIKAAHRRLMTKLHPDHGGSGYLAAQLNQAKDLLLGRP